MPGGARLRPVILFALLAAGTAAAPSCPGEEAEPARRIETGDRLRIRVLHHPVLDVRAVRVASDGTVAVPRGPRVRAAGLTPSQLASVIETALDRYVAYRGAVVLVHVLGPPPAESGGP